MPFVYQSCYINCRIQIPSKVFEKNTKMHTYIKNYEKQKLLFVKLHNNICYYYFISSSDIGSLWHLYIRQQNKKQLVERNLNIYGNNLRNVMNFKKVSGEKGNQFQRHIFIKTIENLKNVWGIIYKIKIILMFCINFQGLFKNKCTFMDLFLV